MRIGSAVLFLALLLIASADVQGQDNVNELRQQLEAQKAINEQLIRRIRELEAQAGGSPVAPPGLRERIAKSGAGDDVLDLPETTTAIQEALGTRGLVLLPAGSYRVIPGLSWGHTGSDFIGTRTDSYAASVTMQAGLPWDLMLTASAPYLHRSTSAGSNSGISDWSIGLAKTLTVESDGRPSVVASVNYVDNNGRTPFAQVPIGYGFPVAAGRLSAVKRFDPVAVYGDVSFAHPFARDVSAPNLLAEANFAGRISPGNTISIGGGASLAVTPAINFDAGLSMAFKQGARIHSRANGDSTQPRSTIGMFTAGAAFVLSRRLSLILGAGTGITADAPDFFFSVALPYRF
ncbi:MAG: hypothetical protein JWN94_573 [Betaproteobacteria bacterium]|nr:hypothetical protein [Betaproteobacteria bacterium]